MNAKIISIKQSRETEAEVAEIEAAEIEAAWVEHAYREDVARRYFKAVHDGDWDEAGYVWLEAHAYDKAREASCSPLLAELDDHASQAA